MSRSASDLREQVVERAAREVADPDVVEQHPDLVIRLMERIESSDDPAAEALSKLCEGRAMIGRAERYLSDRRRADGRAPGETTDAEDSTLSAEIETDDALRDLAVEVVGEHIGDVVDGVDA